MYNYERLQLRNLVVLCFERSHHDAERIFIPWEIICLMSRLQMMSSPFLELLMLEDEENRRWWPPDEVEDGL